MMVRFPRLRAIGTCLALGVLASQTASAVSLVHSNDLLGDIEPCGCRTNPLGGMARKANLIHRLEDKSLLQLDAGDLLYSSNTLPELLKDQSELQARYLLKSMAQLHHDAVVPGEKDFALGVASLEKLAKESKIRFLAANLVKKKSGKLLFEKSAIFKRETKDSKPLKIAVIGIVGDGLPLPPELKIQPALAAARAEVAAARKKADLVVLLTHQGFDKDKQFAEKIKGIDIIVGGHTQSFLQTPIKVGKTIIYQSSFRNQYLGVLPLEKKFDGEGYKLIGLDAGYESPENQPSETDKLVTEFKKSLGELNAKNDAKIDLLAREGAISESSKFHTFPKCAECHLKQFDFWRKTQHSVALSALIDKQQYQNKECLGCHTVGLGDPAGFSSVNALAEYKKLPEPIPSPEVGTMEETSPPLDATIEFLGAEELATYLKAVHDAKSLKSKLKVKTSAEDVIVQRSISSLHRSWAPVQCENCHSPGKDHPFSGTYSKKVEKTTCLNCHTAERAPEWYTKDGKPDWTKIDAKKTQITCPAGDLIETDD